MDEAAGRTSSKGAAERPCTEEPWKGTSELAEISGRKALESWAKAPKSRPEIHTPHSRPEIHSRAFRNCRNISRKLLEALLHT